MIFMIRLVYIEIQEIYIINFKSSPGHELGWYIMKSSDKCSAFRGFDHAQDHSFISQ